MAVTDIESGVILADVWLGTADGALAVGDVNIKMLPHLPNALAVTTRQWECIVSPGTYRTVIDGKRQSRFDVSIVALVDPLASPVAPHGLLGQGYDMLRIGTPTHATHLHSSTPLRASHIANPPSTHQTPKRLWTTQVPTFTTNVHSYTAASCRCLFL